MKSKDLKLEMNNDAEEIRKKAASCNLVAPNGASLMITPPVGEDFWLFRVKVSEKQAIVGFPKFGTIGVGFAIEEQDWNTNLPYCTDGGAEQIYDHIAHNAKVEWDDKTPSKAVCLSAIRMVIDAAKQLRA